MSRTEKQSARRNAGPRFCFVFLPAGRQRALVNLQLREMSAWRRSWRTAWQNFIGKMKSQRGAVWKWRRKSSRVVRGKRDHERSSIHLLSNGSDYFATLVFVWHWQTRAVKGQRSWRSEVVNQVLLHPPTSVDRGGADVPPPGVTFRATNFHPQRVIRGY